ncbi:MAG: PIN domain nuclease [Anaerolineae bacterium]
MVVIDTTVWIDFFNNIETPQTAWLDMALDQRRLGLTDLILCEILQGVRNEQQAAETLQELSKFEILPMGGVDLAIMAAKHYRTLRAQGRMVRKTADCLIATYCLMHDHALLHNDRDFDAFEQSLGLRVVHPKNDQP